ncbi:MAG: asparagine synthase (glutamine-hydrolyzing) [Rugosibacter sp.]|nr:asparagine synthase (glutamine-hydrolyzing) [Rugosibacter sp.]
MCGIAGFIGQGSAGDLERMTAALAHRGPDSEGVWIDEAKGVYLGHRRLSIIDVAGGQQPMWTRDGRLGIVFNGEIYNFAELRQELEKAGHRFETDHSDTEVLLHGYRQWGRNLTARLNGMWAFALYDKTAGILFCSRDRVGKKPFYYTEQNGVFAFASESTALLEHSAVRATVSPRALKKYFAYGYIPSPLSLYGEISKLPAGCSLEFSLADHTLTIDRYWQFMLEPAEERPVGIEDRWADELRHLLEQAVGRRLVADVPLGVFLSGGVDSSAVAAIASRQLGAGQLATFSIGFEEADFDESRYAERVARHIGSCHYPEVLSLDKARASLPEILRRMDEPLGDSSILPTYLLCKHARRHVTVALGGDGADELFAGYAPFRALRWARLYHRLVPQPLHEALRALAGRLPAGHGYMSLDFKIKRTLRGLSYPEKLWNPMWMSVLEASDLDQLFQEPVDLEDVFSEAIALWDTHRPAGLEEQTLQFFTRLYLENDILTKVDRASMMNSLEVRAPFLDSDVIDFARKIPTEYKLRRGQTKYLLKKAMAPLLPSQILFRAKQGFAVPVARWFREGSLHLGEGRTVDRLAPDAVARLLAEHRAGRANQHAFLWSYLALEAALRRQP